MRGSPIVIALVAAGLSLIAGRPDVREVVWYQLAGAAREHTGWDTGLLDDDGTPRPAFAALREAFRALAIAGR